MMFEDSATEPMSLPVIVNTVARMLPIPYCWVAEMLSDTVAQKCGCTQMCGKLTFPGRYTGCTGSGYFPGRDEVHGRLSLYKAGLCR